MWVRSARVCLADRFPADAFAGPIGGEVEDVLAAVQPLDRGAQVLMGPLVLAAERIVHPPRPPEPLARRQNQLLVRCWPGEAVYQAPAAPQRLMFGGPNR